MNFFNSFLNNRRNSAADSMEPGDEDDLLENTLLKSPAKGQHDTQFSMSETMLLQDETIMDK